MKRHLNQLSACKLKSLKKFLVANSQETMKRLADRLGVPPTLVNQLYKRFSIVKPHAQKVMRMREMVKLSYEYRNVLGRCYTIKQAAKTLGTTPKRISKGIKEYGWPAPMRKSHCLLQRNLKRCSRCQEVKSLKQFYRCNVQGYVGNRQRICIKCQKTVVYNTVHVRNLKKFLTPV